MEIIAFLRRHLSYISQPLNLLGEDHSPRPPQAPSPATPLHCDLLPCISSHDHSFPLATHKYH